MHGAPGFMGGRGGVGGGRHVGAAVGGGAAGARGRGGRMLVEAGDEDMHVACPQCFNGSPA